VAVALAVASAAPPLAALGAPPLEDEGARCRPTVGCAERGRGGAPFAVVLAKRDDDTTPGPAARLYGWRPNDLASHLSYLSRWRLTRCDEDASSALESVDNIIANKGGEKKQTRS